jgi:hypothetical protein
MNKDVDREKASEDLKLDALRRLEDLEKEASEHDKSHRGHIDFSKGIVYDEFLIMGNLTVQHWYPVSERVRFEKQTI